jgi:transcriptional regulator with XRE-family HTH domain
MGTDHRAALGTAVRVRRERAKLAGTELARLSGISRSTISRLENGHVDPTWATMRLLAGALGATLAELAEDAERLGR